MNTALVLTVPEAEPLVGELRRRYDPSAADGKPTHVTVVYPFRPWPQFAPDDELRLAELFARFAPFEMSFNALDRFPGVLWLAMNQPDLVVALVRAVAAAFPDCQPYGGVFDSIRPHLTIAHPAASQAASLDGIAATFMTGAEGRLPIRQPVRFASLFHKPDGGRWGEVRRFPLAGG